MASMEFKVDPIITDELVAQYVEQLDEVKDSRVASSMLKTVADLRRKVV